MAKSMDTVDLTRVPIRYVLEHYLDGSLIGATTLPSTPQQHQIEPVFGTLVGYTFGDEPDRQHTPVRKWNVVLAGHAGTDKRPAYTSTGNVQTMSGGQACLEFNAFLQGYQELAADLGARYLQDPDSYRQLRNRTFLVFRAFDENLHLRVELPPQGAWSYKRDKASARLGSYDWRLTFHGYAEASATVPRNVLGPVGDRSEVSALASAASAVSVAISLALGRTQVGVASALSALGAPARKLKLAAEQARRAVEDAQALTSFPRHVLLDLAVAAEQARAAFEEARSSGVDMDGMSLASRRVRDAFGQTEDLCRQAVTAYGKARGGPGAFNKAVASTVDSQPQSKAPAAASGLISYTLRPGDDLKTVAEALLGNPGLWASLAYANGMPDAYHGADGKPLHPGDVLLVPSTAVGSTLSGDVYGTDAYLDPETDDLVPDAEPVTYQDAAGAFHTLPAEATDIRMISGEANLKQALYNRIRTPRGSIRSLTQYGLLSRPGTTAPQAASVAAHLREQMLRDHRVTDVTDVVVVGVGDAVTAEMMVHPVASAKVGVIVPVA